MTTKKRVALGIDPDTTNIGFGVVEEGDRILRAGLIQGGNPKADVRTRILLLVGAIQSTYMDLKQRGIEPDIIVVEGQRYRHQAKKNKVRPQDLIHLAQVAGMCITAAHEFWPSFALRFPEPAEWKGTIPKEVYTRRTCKRMNILSDVKQKCLMQGSRVISDPYPLSQHTHAIDGIAMAWWGLRQ